MNYQVIDTPQFARELVIYEVATPNFTTTGGPESGTFVSLAEKMPYLQDLGVNAIWLSGHQLCNGTHFYNIWNEYACIRPDVLDPRLGSEEDFRAMVDCAHRHSIRVLLDVITHGVMRDSPLVAEHPSWFKEGTWGMADFDWFGGHQDLDDWWVQTWSRYVQQFGIDGFRLDVATYRNDLWAAVRKRAADAGHPIVILAENGPAVRGVVDMLQKGETIMESFGETPSLGLLDNVAQYCRDWQRGLTETYTASIYYQDGTVQEQPELRLVREPDRKELIPCPSGAAYETHKAVFRIENARLDKPVRNVVVRNNQNRVWNSNLDGILTVDYRIETCISQNTLYLQIPLRVQDGQMMSVQLSCHDNGWEGFPPEENPYAARGRRHIMGYSVLLAPAVPILMSGEEFDAGYRPLPHLSARLYEKENLGGGRWLYGSWIDWEQLNHPDKRAMLEDTKRLLAIRRKFSHLISPCLMGEAQARCIPLPSSQPRLPVPYLYLSQDSGEGLLVMANPSQTESAALQIDFHTALAPGCSYTAAPLFGMEPFCKELDAQALSKEVWRLSPDCRPGGGVGVIHLLKK